MLKVCLILSSDCMTAHFAMHTTAFRILRFWSSISEPSSFAYSHWILLYLVNGILTLSKMFYKVVQTEIACFEIFVTCTPHPALNSELSSILNLKRRNPQTFLRTIFKSMSRVYLDEVFKVTSTSRHYQCEK